MTGAAHDFKPKAQHENELLSPELRSTSMVSTTPCARAAAAMSSIPFKRDCS